MPYNAQDELMRVKAYYEGDPLQKRFSALITGETGSGKSFLARTCRMPIHIDSFDPGGTKGLRDLITKGDIVADTSWENEDPYQPKRFAEWMKATDIRIKSGYFKLFGTYILDSATTWGEAIMNYQLNAASASGTAPKWNRDYGPQKVYMINYIKKLMSIPCDFILTGHLRQIEETIGMDKSGNDIKKVIYRFLTTGQAVITIPLLFDELYVMTGKATSKGIERQMLIESQGQYIARSRLKAIGKLNSTEPPDIKALLRKIDLDTSDKPKLNFVKGGENDK